MSVVSLHQAKPFENVVESLRLLANRIEQGEVDWPVTTCVVIIGHTDSEIPDKETRMHYQQSYWETYGYGPRSDTFTVRGLLASALKNWEHE